MAISTLSHEDVLAASRAPSAESVYFLGPFNSRITFYSQQVRALRLAHAMDALAVVKDGEKVAVIGAGAAGSTIAAALALTGKEVTLYDPADKILQLQSASSRLLHPHIYEWPKLGALDARAGLPIMDWTADTGGEVCKALRAEFSKIKASLANLSFSPGHRLTDIVAQGKAWLLSFEKDGTTEQRIFQHVVLGIGFGNERKTGDVVPEDYWRPGAIGTSATEPVFGTRYFVSGNGDGALTEALGLMIESFEHVEFTRKFLGYIPGDDLRAAADAVFAGSTLDQDVEATLGARLLQVLSVHGVLDRLRPQIRQDRVITLNTNGPLFAANRASQLNQCMVFAVLEAARLEGLQIGRTTGFVTGTTAHADGKAPNGVTSGTAPHCEAYKHLIFRHGPDIDERYAAASTLIAAYKTHMAALLPSHPLLAAPPSLDEATYVLFEDLRIRRLADHASMQGQLEQARRAQRVIEILADAATGAVVERGTCTLAQVAGQCEQLADRITVDLHVGPVEIGNASDLTRLARASSAMVDLRAHISVRDEWQLLLASIAVAPEPSSVRHARDLDTSSLAKAVDASLMRALDDAIKLAVSNGHAPKLGALSKDLCSEISAIWERWHASLNTNADLCFDFLRWLSQVDQPDVSPWDGERSDIQRMANALIMIAAANCTIPMEPISGERGNFGFETDAVALATGCDAVGGELIAIRTEPDDWGVDALILSATNEVVVNNPPGRIMDGGVASRTFRGARRVSPAIIQNSLYWRTRLAGDLTAWNEAVDAEFARWKSRQDDELNGVAQ